ncbi:MAG: LicD family protein [Clostridia bacterium]|nr:LicD family protein [Clostridia bacterium]
MSEVKVIEGADFRKMQLLQVEMLVELDRVCRANHIKYQIWAGTLLGAVRHKGYIPWDDDADVVMLREEYEKFKKCIDQLNPDICFYQDHETDPEYRWGYAKLRRTGTTYVRLGQEHIKCQTGVFIDIFPLDDVPRTTLGQMLQDFHCFILRKILWSEVGKYQEHGLLKWWYTLLSKIPVRFVFKQLDFYAKKSSNHSPNMVRTLCYTSIGKLYRKHPIKQRYGMPKRWFTNLETFEFEGRMFWGLKDYDEYLTFSFGDYMQLPPEDKRVQHAPVSDYKF